MSKNDFAWNDDPQTPYLIADVPNMEALPKRFRMTTDPLPEMAGEAPSLLGFAELNVSGSGQFSHNGLRQMKRRFGDRPVTIVDLRQESHGFVNGIAVSWYSRNNNLNKGLSPDQALTVENGLLRRIAEAPSVAFETCGGKGADVGGPIKDKTVVSEEELVRSEGLDYIRFFVTDHHRPLDEVADGYIRWVQTLPQGSWLHFHCRGGVGRTSTFIAMLDMMRHAGDVSLDDILNRHIRIGGKDFGQMNPEDAYKYEFALERIAFIRKFYDYCLAQRPQRFAATWSEWIAAEAEAAAAAAAD